MSVSVTDTDMVSLSDSSDSDDDAGVCFVVNSDDEGESNAEEPPPQEMNDESVATSKRPRPSFCVSLQTTSLVLSLTLLELFGAPCRRLLHHALDELPLSDADSRHTAVHTLGIQWLEEQFADDQAMKGNEKRLSCVVLQRCSVNNEGKRIVNEGVGGVLRNLVAKSLKIQFTFLHDANVATYHEQMSLLRQAVHHSKHSLLEVLHCQHPDRKVARSIPHTIP